MKGKKRTRAPFERQAAVDQAEFWLHVDSARRYGLIAGGPEVNVARCEEILREGRRRGIRPSPGCVERIAKEYMESAHA